MCDLQHRVRVSHDAAHAMYSGTYFKGGVKHETFSRGLHLTYHVAD